MSSWKGSKSGSRLAISSSVSMDSRKADPFSPAKSWKEGRSKVVSASSRRASTVEGGFEDAEDEGGGGLERVSFRDGGGFFGAPRWGRLQEAKCKSILEKFVPAQPNHVSCL